jgi:hypothetical protein
MRNYRFLAVVAVSTILTTKPAIACLLMAPRALSDIKYADVVVLGKITNYELVLDQSARRQRQERLSQPDLAPDLRRMLSEQKRFLSDYARFKVLVEEVLVGQPANVISVTWDNSTFGEPENMPEGPYLIGLRNPSSRIPPLRGPSATVLPTPEPNSLTVLQAPCASAFIFEAMSPQAKTIREILGGKAK